MKIGGTKVLKTSLVAAAATAALLAGTAQAAHATLIATCTAWSFGTCTTDSIPASSDHWIHYDVGPCGWGNVIDAETHKHVGPYNVLAGGSINGLYGGHYYMIVRSTGGACVGAIHN